MRALLDHPWLGPVEVEVEPIDREIGLYLVALALPFARASRAFRLAPGPKALHAAIEELTLALIDDLRWFDHVLAEDPPPPWAATDPTRYRLIRAHARVILERLGL